MATLQYKAVEISTEKFNQLNCAMCYTNGDFIENLNFCIECQKYYCTSCLTNHLNSRPTKFSQILQNNNEKDFSRENLNINENDAANRNLYENGQTNNVVNAFFETTEYKNLANALRKKKLELNTLGTQKDAIINIMKQFKESAAEMLKEFDKSVDEKIQAEEKEAKQKLNQEIQRLEKSMKNLKDNTSKSESKSMVNYGYEAEIEADHPESPQGSNTDHPESRQGSDSFSTMQNILETAIEDFTYKINKTGSYLIGESGHLWLQVDECDVQLADDRGSCDINDMCRLHDGSVLLCDWNNTRIKRLTPAYEPRDTCSLPGIPWAICSTGTAEVAVSLFLLERVQFVKISSAGMKPTRGFKVGHVCRGLCYTDNKLVVSCGGGGIGEGPGHIRIFNKFGILLNIAQDNALDSIFSCPHHLTVAQGVVYLTDRDNGLVQLQWSGLHQLQPASTTAPPQNGLARARGLCQGDAGASTLFICDFKNGTVVHVNTETGVRKVLVQNRNKLTGPQSICYDSKRRQLAVAAGNSNVVQIYQLTTASRNTYL